MIAVTNNPRGASDKTTFRVPPLPFARDSEPLLPTANAIRNPPVFSNRLKKLAFFRHRNILKTSSNACATT
jgi:hypothetical protein